MKQKPYLLLITACLVCLSNCAQTNVKSRMKEITRQLTHALTRGDSTAILDLYDTAFSHINQKYHRDFIIKGVSKNIQLFNKVESKHRLPDLSYLTFSKDSTNGSNEAVLQMLTEPDTSLNLKRCSLIISFYPDNLFIRDKFLRFKIETEKIIPDNINMIKLPPTNQVKSKN